MRKILLLCLLPTIAFISCTKSSGDGLIHSLPRTDSILGKYLLSPSSYPDFFASYLGVPDNQEVYFIHNKENQLIKRLGGEVSDIFTAYSNEIYDTVIYKSSEDIILTTINNDSYFQIPPSKRELILKGGLVKLKIYYNIGYYGSMANDTVEYFYDAKNRLSKTIMYLGYQNLESDFSFDNAGNLAKVFSYYRINKTGIADSTTSWNEEFVGYDNVSNPLKGVCLWDDLLYRSLSNNNFTTYNYQSNGVGWGGYTWTLTYNANGQVDFSK